MGLSRRRILQGGVALTVSAMAGWRIAGRGTGPAAWLERSSYTPLVDTTFGVNSPAGRRDLTLVAVRDLMPGAAEQPPEWAERQFSLLFISDATFPQGAYPIHHRLLGDATLFVVPVGARGAVQHYEAVVNRLP